MNKTKKNLAALLVCFVISTSVLGQEKKLRPWDLQELKQLTDEQANYIVRKKFVLDFPKLEVLSDRQAEQFSKDDFLSLPSLKVITTKQALWLGKIENLELDSIATISDEQAELLANCQRLRLGLKKLSDKQANCLGQINSLALTQPLTLSSAQTKSLGNCNSLNLVVSKLTDEQADFLGHVKRLTLNGLRSLTDRQAESLGRCKALGISGLNKVSDQHAKSLARVSQLDLYDLTQLSDYQAKYLGCVRELNLPELRSITDKQADHLGKVKSLFLGSITEISDSQAVSLANVEELHLGAVKLLSNRQAKLLFNTNSRKLKELAISIWRFENEHGHYPFGVESEQSYGWRVRLAKSKHFRIRVDLEQLDSAQMPAIFGSDSKATFRWVKPWSQFQEYDKGIRVQDVLDGTSNTVMLVEDPVGQNWRANKPLSVLDAIENVRSLPKGKQLSVVFYDGSLGAIGSDIPRSKLFDMFHPNNFGMTLEQYAAAKEQFEKRK